MDIENLINTLKQKGIKLTVNNNELKIQAPKGVVSPELQKDLIDNKSKIIDFLNFKSNPKQITEMDFSLFFFASDDSTDINNKYKLVIDSALFADKNGFKGIWTPERHFHKLGGIFSNPAIIASALSTITTNIKLRAGSVVLPINNPVRIVEDWSMIDNLSNGRVELSFASGWHINDFVLAPDNYKKRKKIMFENIETVKKLWRGDLIKMKNGAGTLTELITLPRPLQKELPVWVTAIGNPETYIQAGTIGANLMTCLFDQDINELSEKVKLYRNSLKENAFDPYSKKVALFAHTYIGDNLEEVKRKVYKPITDYLDTTLDLIGKFGLSADFEINPSKMSSEDKKILLDFAFERFFESRTLIGTKETCFNMINKLKDAGVDEIGCLIDFGLSYDDIFTSLNKLSYIIAKSN